MSKTILYVEDMLETLLRRVSVRGIDLRGCRVAIVGGFSRFRPVHRAIVSISGRGDCRLMVGLSECGPERRQSWLRSRMYAPRR